MIRCGLLCVFLAVCVTGLGASRRVSKVHSQSVTLPAIPNLFAWWVSSDETIGTSLESSDWEDRIASKVVRGLPGYPGSLTNTVLGWNFDWALDASGAATNVSITAGTNQTVCVITYPREAAGAPNNMSLIYGPWELDDVTQANAATHGGLVWTSSRTVSWGSTFVGGPGPIISSALALSNWVEMVLVQSNTTAYFYTNGVLSSSFSRTPPTDGYPWNMISDDRLSSARAYAQFLREIIIWSTNLTSLQVSNVHQYRLATYP